MVYGRLSAVSFHLVLEHLTTWMAEILRILAIHILSHSQL